MVKVLTMPKMSAKYSIHPSADVLGLTLTPTPEEPLTPSHLSPSFSFLTLRRDRLGINETTQMNDSIYITSRKLTYYQQLSYQAKLEILEEL